MRLIDRQAVIDALWNIQRGLQMMDSERVDKTIHGIQLALHTIEQMPTVDAVPGDHCTMVYGKNKNVCTCSACKNKWFVVHADITRKRMNYCPSCGLRIERIEDVQTD